MAAPQRFVLRELLLIAITAGLWTLEFGMVGTDGLGADAFRVVVGLFTLLLGFLAHEWGHLIASLATGAVVHYPPGWVSKLLFDFDVRRNDRRQFLWMNVGGYAAAALALTAFVWFLPADRLAGQVALGGMVLGTAVLLAIELPITVRVLRGAEPPLPLVSNDPEQRR